MSDFHVERETNPRKICLIIRMEKLEAADTAPHTLFATQLMPQLKNQKRSTLYWHWPRRNAGQKTWKNILKLTLHPGMVCRQIDREMSRRRNIRIYVCMQNMLDRRLTFTNDKHLTNKMLFLCLHSSCVREAFNVGLAQQKRAAWHIFAKDPQQFLHSPFALPFGLLRPRKSEKAAVVTTKSQIIKWNARQIDMEYILRGCVPM